MYRAAKESSAFYSTTNFIINIGWDVTGTGQDQCIAYDIQDVSGNDLKNGLYCPGQAAISLP